MLANQDILDQLSDALAELPEPGEEIYNSAAEWPPGPWDEGYWEPIDYLGVDRLPIPLIPGARGPLRGRAVDLFPGLGTFGQRVGQVVEDVSVR